MVQPDGKSRISKIDTYLNVAEAFAYRSTCLKRKYGAVIVKDDVVVSTGYNGSPRGYTNCCDTGSCPRIERNLHQGQGYELCRAIHAEQNAIIQAAKLGVSIEGATLYCTHQPCVICAKMIVNSGIRRVVYGQGYPDDFALEMLAEGGVVLERFPGDGPANEV